MVENIENITYSNIKTLNLRYHTLWNNQGLSYHWGQGGTIAPPIGIAPAPHKTFEKLKFPIRNYHIFYNDSAKTLLHLRIYCKISVASPPNPVLYLNKHYNLLWHQQDQI